MKTPFTASEFFGVFDKYNTSMFPLQWIIILSGFVALFILFSKYSSKDKLIGGFLGFLWIWMGTVYHISFFSAINPAAYAFGAAFFIQGLLIFFSVFVRGSLQFKFNHNAIDYVAYFILLFALIIYPALSIIMIDSLWKPIALGLPCPTTIYTLGFFILGRSKFPKYLLIVPVIWSIIGFSAALLFGVYQDVMLLVAALSALLIIFFTKNQL